MDYTDFMNRRVVAYFTKERNVFCVDGKLERADSEYLTFKDADLDIISVGESIQQDYEPTEEKEDENDYTHFSIARFKESDLIGICRLK